MWVDRNPWDALGEGAPGSSAPGTASTTNSAEQAWGLGVPQPASRAPSLWGAAPGSDATVLYHAPSLLSATPGGDATLYNTPDQFKEKLIAAADEMNKRFGGPRQYLLTLYATATQKKEFSNKLFDWFPMLQDTVYQTDNNVPLVTEAELSERTALVVHISNLSFEERASTKQPPGREVCMKLVNEMCCDGFISSGDPLLLTKPQGLMTHVAPWCKEVQKEILGETVTVQEPENQLPAQSLGHYKSQARSVTLLALVSLCMEDGMTRDAFVKATSHHPPPSELMPPPMLGIYSTLWSRCQAWEGAEPVLDPLGCRVVV